MTLASVPGPPADLAGRIKADIPNYLKATQDERERFSRSIAFNFRVAASILLLFSSLFVVIHLMTREPGAESNLALMNTQQPKAARVANAVPPPADAVPTEEVRVQIAQEPRPVPSAPASTVAPPPAAPRVQVADVAPARHEFSGYAYNGGRVDDAEMKFESTQETTTLAAAAVPPPE